MSNISNAYTLWRANSSSEIIYFNFRQHTATFFALVFIEMAIFWTNAIFRGYPNVMDLVQTCRHPKKKLWELK